MRAAFAILGIEPGASVVEIKKAYARLLKKTRPEDDAAGFQRLQEAYEACIAFSKRNAARVEGRVRELVPAGVDDEDGDEAGLPTAELPELAPVRSRIVPVAPPPPLRGQAAPSTQPLRARAPVLAEPELLGLLEQIVVEGERLNAYGLRKWLHAHDALVSLDVQRLVAVRLPAFILERKPQLDPENLHAIYEYFIGSEYNPAHSDPRLRMAWEQVHADHLFRREIAALRRRHYRYFERLAIDELLEAPKASRRRLLLAVPGMVGRIAGFLAHIRGFDPERAEQVLQPEAAAFWGALGAPGRMPWRLVALVHAQLAVFVALLVGVLGWMQGLDATGFLSMSAVGLFDASLVWFLFKGIGIVRHRLEVRRLKRLAAGIEPRDTLLTVSYVFCAVGALFAAMQFMATGPEAGGAAVAISCAGLVMLLQFLSGRGKRWEMALIAVLATMAAWRVLAIVVGALVPGAAIAGMAFVAGALIGVLADEWHAKRERLLPANARMDVNHIALKLSGAFFLAFLLSLAIGNAKQAAGIPDSGRSRAQIEQQERDDARARQTEVNARIQEAVAKMQRDSRPWHAWAEKHGVTELPKFASVDLAFANLREAAAPFDPADTPLRAFHIPDGPLAGDWLFSGGDRISPDYVVHYPLEEMDGERKAGQMLCRSQDAACRRSRAASRLAPLELGLAINRVNGGRITWDSPGAPPTSFDCPKADLMPHEVDALTRELVHARVLFNGEGGVVASELAKTNIGYAVESAVFAATYRCQIVPDAGRPGILETDIALR